MLLIHMLRPLAVVAALAATAPVVAAAQAPATPQRVRALLGALANDSMAGRATGTPGAAKAARFIAGVMAQAGIAPAGDSGFFQRVAVAKDSVAVPQRRRVSDGVDSAGKPRFRFETVDGPPVWRTTFKVLPTLADLDTVPPVRRVPAVNVVGIIHGSDPAVAAEYVLIDAHYDHLGIGASVNGDSIYNGADDDASGTVAVLEIARQMAAGPKPRRTVVFMATIGEERGLLGTRWYISHPVIPLDRMAANLEIEMIARPDSLAGGSGRAWLTGYERSTMGDELAAAGVPIGPDRRPEQNFFQRSDNIAFARAGIPAHTLSTFNLHTDYHQPSDDVDKVDFDHMAAVINAATRAARLLSDGPKPQWKPGGKP
ncbi:MAG: M20/M25/M40 family metallo-hydrolase [Gemmatimonadaceae bacterium]|nr:M20/M25/M40 family metallo-hydrolase [Gemmatimonadaceae bacterium]